MDTFQRCNTCGARFYGVMNTPKHARGNCSGVFAEEIIPHQETPLDFMPLSTDEPRTDGFFVPDSSHSGVHVNLGDEFNPIWETLVGTPIIPNVYIPEGEIWMIQEGTVVAKLMLKVEE